MTKDTGGVNLIYLDHLDINKSQQTIS